MNIWKESAGSSARTDGPRPPLALAVAGLVLAASLYTNLGRAQGPGEPAGQGNPGGQRGDINQPGPGGQGGPGGFGQGRRGGFGGPGGQGGFRGFGGGFITGNIVDGDANRGIIVVSSGFGGQQTIKVNANTQFVTQKTVDVSALQVGDQVQVQGVPTAITASSISAGQLPDVFRMGGFGGPGGPGVPPAPGAQGGNQGVLLSGDPPGGARGGGQMRSQQAFASATGKVTAVSPLTISIGDGVSVVLKLGAGAKVTKIQKSSINALKNGDNILAAGQPGEDGTFNATGIGVGVTMGGFGGPGGFGPGGFGPGGPGGPGGFGGRGRGGPGGQGGPGGPGGELGAPPPPPPSQR